MGRQEEAVGLLRSALAAFHDLDDTDGVAECVERLGEAFAEEEPAPRLLLAARAIREREQIGLRPIDEAPATELLATVMASLTPTELESARADANAMDAEAAVASRRHRADDTPRWESHDRRC